MNNNNKMDQTNLGKPVFKAISEDNTSNNEDEAKHDDERRLSLETIAKMKINAGRARRRSLFDFDRSEIDMGQSTLSHADFPTTPIVKPRSLSVNDGKEIEFDKAMIYGILEQEMNRKLSGKYYDHAQCEIIAKHIVTAVKDRIAALTMKTFKVVCVCYITQRASPSMKLESGCAWDDFIATVEKDNFVDCVFQNEFLSSVASVYGVCCQRVPHKPTRRSSSFPKSQAAQVHDARF